MKYFSGMIHIGTADPQNVRKYIRHCVLEATVEIGLLQSVIFKQTEPFLRPTQGFIEFCSPGSNQQYSNIGSDNGLAPIRWHVIIWTSDGSFTDEYMRHSTSTYTLWCMLIIMSSGKFRTFVDIFILAWHNKILRGGQKSFGQLCLFGEC